MMPINTSLSQDKKSNSFVTCERLRLDLVTMPGPRKWTSWCTATCPAPPSATGSASPTSSTRTSTSTPRTTSPSSGQTSGKNNNEKIMKKNTLLTSGPGSPCPTTVGTVCCTPATGPTHSRWDRRGPGLVIRPIIADFSWILWSTVTLLMRAHRVTAGYLAQIIPRSD